MNTNEELQRKLEAACWVAKTLFARNKATGSSANLSFRHGDNIYITNSGTCFGRLTTQDFTPVSLAGEVLGTTKPSKEFPLHQALYQKDAAIGAVVHTHSFYSTLWSCLPQENEQDIMPEYTPYLKMKLGTVGLVPYAKPGSEELFAAFRAVVNGSDGFLLANHGPIVPGKDILSAFYSLEELEESAHIAWTVRQETGINMLAREPKRLDCHNLHKHGTERK